MGKKIGLGIVGLIIVGAMYYFMGGSEQLTQEMKKVVSTELTSLQKEGFSIQDKKIKAKEEHFTLTFDDTDKITKFLNRQGVQINRNDALLLKDFKLGIDVNYLADTYSAVTFDVYPLTFPSFVLSMAENDKEKAIFQELLKKKAFLAHIAINKLGNGFKGNMKDINEVLHGEQTVTLKMQGFTFSGDLKDQRIAALKENLNTLSFLVDDKVDFTLSSLQSEYITTGKTPYDYKIHYTINNIKASTKDGANLLAKNILMNTESLVKDGLASGNMIAKVNSLHVNNKGKAYTLNDFTFESNAKGVDVAAFEKLQTINVNNEKEVEALLKEMMSKGVSFDISKFSVAHIKAEGKELNGFNVTSHLNLDKSFDITALQTNPMSVLSSVDANLHLTLSKEIFEMVAQIPQAMMALMLFQPKDVNGKKVYQLELKDGKFTVNNMPVN